MAQVSLALMDRVLRVDAERRQVTVQAGARVQEVRCWHRWCLLCRLFRSGSLLCLWVDTLKCLVVGVLLRRRMLAACLVPEGRSHVAISMSR